MGDMSDDPDRLALHAKLLELVPGVNLYFRPTSKALIKYPCIVYTVKSPNAIRANNSVYATGTTFSLTFMSNLPGSSDSKKLLYLDKSRFKTSYISDDIVHDIFDVTIKTF